MVALSDRKLEIVRTLVQTAPDSIVGGLRAALQETSGDTVLSSVRQLVEAEAQDRALALGKGAQDRAGALGKDAQERAGEYREQLADRSSDLLDEARALGGQAKAKAAAYAETGKTRASDALTGLGRIVADSAETIDDKLGVKYGDYARGAARSIHETAAKLDSKELGELGEDAREFVRKSPGVAVGLAAVAGFMLARMFRGSED